MIKDEKILTDLSKGRSEINNSRGKLASWAPFFLFLSNQENTHDGTRAAVHNSRIRSSTIIALGGCAQTHRNYKRTSCAAGFVFTRSCALRNP